MVMGLPSFIFFFQTSKPLLISSEEICFPRFYREEKFKEFDPVESSLKCLLFDFVWGGNSIRPDL